MAHTGKIARLPHDLREEVNRRLLDNQTSAILLPWLNAQPEAVRLWEHEFEGVPASAENLSQWRRGGFLKWKDRAERVENLKTLSNFAADLATNGRSLADGAASIVSGHILEALEQMGNIVVTGGQPDSEKDPNEGLAVMANAVSALQRAATAKGKLELDKRKVAQKDQQLTLDREKFEKQTVEQFMRFAKTPEANAILNSSGSQQIKMEALRELMFGKVKPQEVEP